MTRLTWSNTDARHFETGLDRGVLYLKDGRTAPWIGLSAVEEAGGEGLEVYYIDGRPFLLLPKPKEFSATIKAVTYPDEFSSVMGFTEATDGMYLDSQMGESFDLSYRTLIGNMLEGSDAGYKIHLIYNASVNLESLSYESLSDSVNPTEFSWDIQAVPVPIYGFRPTAHVIIDTRHLDPSNLAEIEAMLYGDDTTDPYMPDPNTIFNMLHFGDSTVVADNGDGTWVAEGSYKNVSTTDDGLYQIDGVDATFNPDGTYTITTT